MRAGLGLAVWMLLGCGGKAAEPATPGGTGSDAPAKPSPEVEDAIGAMTSFQDRMCACADKPCVEKVAGEMGAWSENQAKKYAGNEPVPSDEQKDRMTKIGEKLGACMTQAAAAPAPASE
jgi:hypothetical protein